MPNSPAKTSDSSPPPYSSRPSSSSSPASSPEAAAAHEDAPSLLSHPSQPTPPLSALRSAPPPSIASRPRSGNIMDRLFRFSLPQRPSNQAIHTAGVYISGALFSLGFWFFIDASVYSKVNNPGNVHIKFVDWIPGICSASGMLVINSIEKSHLNSDSFSYTGGPSVARKAQYILFLGFALMAGGLAGSVAVLVLKYIVEKYEFETMYFGIANVVANSLIMLSSTVLWISQNMEDDYAYPLQL